MLGKARRWFRKATFLNPRDRNVAFLNPRVRNVAFLNPEDRNVAFLNSGGGPAGAQRGRRRPNAK